MTTLKSSVVSKSSYPLLDHDDGRFSFNRHERARALRSSWINRLHLRLPHDLPPLPPQQQRPVTTSSPYAAASGLGLHRAIFADESPTCALAPDLNPFSVSGFGPFRFRARKILPHGAVAPSKVDHAPHCGFPFLRGFATVAGGGDSKMIPKSVAVKEDRDADRSFLQQRNVRSSLFFRLHRSPATGRADIDKGKKIVQQDPTTSCPSSPSGDKSHIRPLHFRNGRSLAPLPQIIPPELASGKRLLKELWGGGSSGTSTRHVSRRRGGGIYRDTIDDSVQFRPFGNLQSLHQNSVQRHPERQNPALHCEPEETFSYWNMGRFKRKTTISSVSTHIALSENFFRKRDFNADDSFPSKFRKLGSKS